MYKAVRYNPEIHHRRSIRLKGFDYSKAGKYFITICCQDHACRFGKIENKTMVLNQFGMVAQNEWYKLPDRFHNLQLGAFQVMPNHIHAIIILNEPNAGATLAVAPLNYNNAVSPNHDEPSVSPIHDEQTVSPNHNEQTVAPHDNRGAGASPAPAVSPSNPTVGNIIGAYKSLVSTGILKLFITNNEKMGKLWQRNYYERIIRNQKSYHIISKYIRNNPAKWNK